MLNIFAKVLLALCSLFLCGQVSAACNITFTAASGGQVTFEPANSQYAGQPARYKYLFSAADNANCGNADLNGISDANGASNLNYAGVSASSDMNGNPVQNALSAKGGNGACPIFRV